MPVIQKPMQTERHVPMVHYIFVFIFYLPKVSPVYKKNYILKPQKGKVTNVLSKKKQTLYCFFLNNINEYY